MRNRRRAAVASTLVLLAGACAAAGGILQLLTRDVPVEYYGIRGFQGVFGLAMAAVGWLVTTRVRGNLIGWLLLAAGVVSALQAFDSGYVTLSHDRYGGSLPFTDALTWLSVWIWVGIVGPLGTFVLITFPEGRFQTRAQRIVAWFSAVALAVFAVAVSLTPGQAGETPAGVDNPYALDPASHEPLIAVGGILFILAVGSSMAILVRRFRRAAGDQRQQMKWLTYAASIAVIAISFSTGFLSQDGDIQSLGTRLSAIAVIIGFIGIPLATGIAILRYGLYEIDLVINKTLFYGVLAIFITVIYVGLVVGVGAIVGTGASTELTIGATAVVALAIQPLRSRAQALANRLVFGKRSSPYEALSGFSARLSEQSGDAMPELARLMTEATAADRATVWLAVGAELRPASSWPRDFWATAARVDGDEPVVPGADHVYAVRHEGELLGALSVWAPPNDPLTSAEDRLLADLASQAGLLLRNAALIEELRASRERLVAAQDLERRRIERDLHDGAQQQLVALAVNLKLLGRLVAEPEQARAMIEQLQADTTDALENLRDLARGIYPPLLAERGLVAALASQTAKAPLPVTVDGDGVGRYAQQAESALYFCALEAVQNVAKYAGASAASVRIWARDQRLGFEVRDDGAGFDVRTVQRGAGLTNMADRLEALGGRLEITSAPGSGTTVTGWVSAVPRDETPSA